jgi:hypothetical protein
VQAYRPALYIITAGLLTFGVLFTLLQFSHSEAAPVEVAVLAPSTPVPVTLSADSLAPQITTGDLVVGVPSGGSTALLKDIQPGDRVSVLVSLPSTDDGRVVTAVAVNGASVVRPASATDPLLLEVSAPDAIVLAHLVLSGIHLGYTVWPTDGTSPPASPPVDESTARALLGLVPLATPTPLAPAAPTPAPPTPAPTRVVAASVTPQQTSDVAGGFLYQVQAGDTWDSIATLFGVPTSALLRFNEGAARDTPLPGSLVTVPRQS